jgi:hypothetical protein
MDVISQHDIEGIPPIEGVFYHAISSGISQDQYLIQLFTMAHLSQMGLNVASKSLKWMLHNYVLGQNSNGDV